ncbi:hypothetical protein [Reyranella sp.]|uniref:hypothetical protein n=1 Tax=Reyranella sp. TaxID=1929291 RepID=UPI003BAD7995
MTRIPSDAAVRRRRLRLRADFRLVRDAIAAALVLGGIGLILMIGLSDSDLMAWL